MLPGNSDGAVGRYCHSAEIEIGPRANSRGVYTFRSADAFLHFLVEALPTPTEQGNYLLGQVHGVNVYTRYGHIAVVEVQGGTERRVFRPNSFGQTLGERIQGEPEVIQTVRLVLEDTSGLRRSSLDIHVESLTGQTVRDPFVADYDPAPRPDWVPVFPGSRGADLETWRNSQGIEVRSYTFTMGYDQVEAFRHSDGHIPDYLLLLTDISPDGVLHPGLDRLEVPIDFPEFTVTVNHQRDVAHRNVIYVVVLEPKRGTVWRPRRSPSPPEPPTVPETPQVRRRALRIG